MDTQQFWMSERGLPQACATNDIERKINFNFEYAWVYTCSIVRNIQVFKYLAFFLKNKAFSQTAFSPTLLSIPS